MKTLQELLKDLDACKRARDWVGDKTIEQSVAECPRGDWMLWLASEVGVNRQSLILTAGHCANTVRHLMIDERSTKAVDTAIAFGEGRASERDLNVARADAIKARAERVLGAVWAIAYEDTAIWTADTAGEAAIRAVMYTQRNWFFTNARMCAMAKNQKQTADICREYIGREIIDRCNQMMKQ